MCKSAFPQMNKYKGFKIEYRDNGQTVAADISRRNGNRIGLTVISTTKRDAYHKAQARIDRFYR